MKRSVTFQLMPTAPITPFIPIFMGSGYTFGPILTGIFKNTPTIRTPTTNITDTNTAGVIAIPIIATPKRSTRIAIKGKWTPTSVVMETGRVIIVIDLSDASATGRMLRACACDFKPAGNPDR
jgi:hypothetical protein